MTKYFHNIYEAANVNFSCLRLQGHYLFQLYIFPVLVVNSLCKTFFNHFWQIPCLEKWTSKFRFPCAVAMFGSMFASLLTQS